MAETPPPHPTPLPPPRPQPPELDPLARWPMVLMIALALFTVAGLVLNLRGCFH